MIPQAGVDIVEIGWREIRCCGAIRLRRICAELPLQKFFLEGSGNQDKRAEEKLGRALMPFRVCSPRL